jgi:hypothetical protein
MITHVQMLADTTINYWFTTKQVPPITSHMYIFKDRWYVPQF